MKTTLIFETVRLVAWLAEAGLLGVGLEEFGFEEAGRIGPEKASRGGWEWAPSEFQILCAFLLTLEPGSYLL